ncbi:MAG: DUF4197 domain-containing protein, partial [Xanthomonadales bacterium]|nr:DUF4197 domain-containing protein [Xanthomonadales bacterium]
MPLSETKFRLSKKVRWIFALLSLALALNSTLISADWLSKLKESIGKKDAEQALSTDEVGGGLKEALRVGTDTVVGKLGQEGGFNLDPKIHIPLPKQLDKARSILSTLGMDSMLVELESKLNEAAETATPMAKQLFIEAINDMTLDDVMAIYKGPDDAATQYFRSRMSAPLAQEMKPVVDDSLAGVGALELYDSVMKQYGKVPFAPEVDL